MGGGGWWQLPLGLLGLVGLIAATVPLADPGIALVPGAVHGGPGWLRGVYGSGLGIDGDEYYTLLWLAFAAYLCLTVGATALGPRVVWTAIALVVVAFALAPPLLSQDVFSYIDYARLGVVHDLNPYVAVPADVRADPSFAHLGWATAVSAYGPLFTLTTYLVGQTSVATALWVLKALAAASVLGVAALCARLAPARGVDPRRAAVFVALNPLVLVHVVGGAHNDGLMMLLLMASVAYGAALRERGEGAALVGAAAVKTAAIFAAPFALLGARRRGRLVVAAAVALAAVVTASLIGFGTHTLDAAGLVGENQAATSYYSVPRTMARILDAGLTPVHTVLLVLYGGLVAWLLFWTWRGGDWVRAAAWAAVGLLVASGWLLPWYLIWALPLAALVRDRTLTGVLIALTAFQLVNRIPL